MPRPSTLPDSGVLAQLRRKHRRDAAHPDGCSGGHTLAQIAEMYGVTVNGLYKAMRRAGLTEERPRHTDTLPWFVAQEHEQAWEAMMLRELSKRNQGLPPGNRGRYLDSWLADLDAKDEVVAYDREKGFSRVRRWPRDGDGYIRKPTKKALEEVAKELRSRRAPG